MRRRYPGFTLPAVLIVVTLAALAATTAMYAADAQRAAVDTVNRRTQSRASAWSGVQAVMSELSRQREELLDGGTPTVTHAWELFTDASGAIGVVRLVDLDPEGEGVLQCESSKLDANHATSDMLVATGVIEASLAESIVAARATGPFMSPEALLEVDGMTPSLLYGQRADDASQRSATGDIEHGSGLIDWLTVFSFDPCVQLGIGSESDSHRGTTKININLPWSDRLGEAMEDRFGAGASDVLKRLMDGGVVFSKDSQIAAYLRQQNMPPEQWGPIFDAITTSDDMYRPGRIDINHAREEVLACVPGITAESAARLVAERERLDQTALQSVTWPVTQQLLTGEEFEKAIDWICVRSMQWRVRVEAGRLRQENASLRLRDNAGAGAADFSGSQIADQDIETAALADRIVLEAVVDVASLRPRIAYLREVTMLPAVTIAAARHDAETAEGVVARAPTPRTPAVPEVRDDSGGVVSPDGRSRPDQPPTAPDTGPMDTRPIEHREESEDESAPAESPVPVEFKDRRIGRWTAGRGGAS